MVNILIVDDHLLMRRAVREVVEKEEDMTVVAEAGNGQEAEVQAGQTQPDVVLMDMDMPDCNGFEATERVLACSPQSRVIIFTAQHTDQHVLQALRHGAIGYITKDIEPEALIHAIRCAARHDLCIPGALATQVLAHLRMTWRTQAFFSTPGMSTSGAIAYRTPRRSTKHQLADNQAEGATTTATLTVPSVRPLTMREREILDLMRRGHKNREIAGELCIAESTVHKHVQNIFEKLHARNRTEAIYLTSNES